MRKDDQRPAKTGGGLVRPALRQQDAAQVAPAFRQVRQQTQDLAIAGGGGRRPAGLLIGEGAVEQCFARIGRAPREGWFQNRPLLMHET